MVLFQSDIHFLLLAAGYPNRSRSQRTRLDGRVGRGPNRAVPRRTRVVPSSTATSRSSVIPIEHVARPSSSTSGRTAGTPAGPPRPALGRPDRHQPVDRRARRPWPLDTRRRTSSVGSRPCSASPVALTWTSTVAPGARRATSSTSDGRSTRLPHRRPTPATRRTLFDCSRPMKCTPRRRRRRPALGEQLLGVVLADRRAARPRPRRRRRRARSPWSRPAARPRPTRRRPGSGRGPRRRWPRPAAAIGRQRRNDGTSKSSSSSPARADRRRPRRTAR